MRFISEKGLTDAKVTKAHTQCGFQRFVKDLSPVNI
jgi:hypothetical protein